MSQRLSTDLKRIRHLPEGPLKAVRLSLWWLRKTFFTKPKPDNPAVFVRLTNQELVELLGREYFEPGWELSYSYRNETLIGSSSARRWNASRRGPIGGLSCSTRRSARNTERSALGTRTK